jgi:hypothetical protein
MSSEVKACWGKPDGGASAAEALGAAHTKGSKRRRTGILSRETQILFKVFCMTTPAFHQYDSVDPAFDEEFA